jgi:hypothetical protein
MAHRKGASGLDALLAVLFFGGKENGRDGDRERCPCSVGTLCPRGNMFSDKVSHNAPVE